MTVTITRESPQTPDLALLFERHTSHCHADTPPESIHMMDRSALDDPAIAFYVLRERGVPLAMGAVKALNAGHGEIKSMHVLNEARGRGFSRHLLDHMIAEAAARGQSRLSLETGAQPSFLGARVLYERAGFHECPPFGSYRPDPMSVFMTRLVE